MLERMPPLIPSTCKDDENDHIIIIMLYRNKMFCTKSRVSSYAHPHMQNWLMQNPKNANPYVTFHILSIITTGTAPSLTH